MPKFKFHFYILVLYMFLVSFSTFAQSEVASKVTYNSNKFDQQENSLAYVEFSSEENKSICLWQKGSLCSSTTEEGMKKLSFFEEDDNDSVWDYEYDCLHSCPLGLSSICNNSSEFTYIIEYGSKASLPKAIDDVILRVHKVNQEGDGEVIDISPQKLNMGMNQNFKPKYFKKITDFIIAKEALYFILIVENNKERISYLFKINESNECKGIIIGSENDTEFDQAKEVGDVRFISLDEDKLILSQSGVSDGDFLTTKVFNFNLDNFEKTNTNDYTIDLSSLDELRVSFSKSVATLNLTRTTKDSYFSDKLYWNEYNATLGKGTDYSFFSLNNYFLINNTPKGIILYGYTAKKKTKTNSAIWYTFLPNSDTESSKITPDVFKLELPEIKTIKQRQTNDQLALKVKNDKIFIEFYQKVSGDKRNEKFFAKLTEVN